MYYVIDRYSGDTLSSFIDEVAARRFVIAGNYLDVYVINGDTIANIIAREVER